MSGEGLIHCIPGHEAWGYAAGVYPVNCIDCPSGQNTDDKILGSISSIRCLYHAIQARCGEHDEGCSMSFYEPEAYDFPRCSWDEIAVEFGAWMMILLMAFLAWTFWQMGGTLPTD